MTDQKLKKFVVSYEVRKQGAIGMLWFVAKQSQAYTMEEAKAYWFDWWHTRGYETAGCKAYEVRPGE